MEQMSLFDMEDSRIGFDIAKRLQVVKAQFIEAQSVVWQELFEGFDEIYAITFSSGIDFTGRIIDRFNYAEIVYGCEGILSDDISAIMATQTKIIEKIVKSKAAKRMSNKMDEDKLKLYVSQDMKSHEKVFLLKANPCFLMMHHLK